MILRGWEGAVEHDCPPRSSTLSLCYRSVQERSDGQIEGPSKASRWPAQALAAQVSRGGCAWPGGEGGSDRAASLVAGRLPNRRRLLLYFRLHTRHRGFSGRSPLARRHDVHRALDPLRGLANVQARRRGEPEWTGVDRHARTSALVVDRQGNRALPPGVRGDRLVDHDNPL